MVDQRPRLALFELVRRVADPAALNENISDLRIEQAVPPVGEIHANLAAVRNRTIPKEIERSPQTFNEKSSELASQAQDSSVDLCVLGATQARVPLAAAGSNLECFISRDGASIIDQQLLPGIPPDVLHLFGYATAARAVLLQKIAQGCLRHRPLIITLIARRRAKGCDPSSRGVILKRTCDRRAAH